MKQTWEKVNKDALAFQGLLTELLENLPSSAFYSKKQGQINKAWRTFTVSFNFMDEFVQPTIKSVKIDSQLLSDPEFKTKWNFWKDYLKEQHATHMRSRAELMALKRLCKISDENTERAIYILEHAMSTLSKSFYIPNEPIAETAAGKSKPGSLKIDVPTVYSAPSPQAKHHQTTIHEQIEKETSFKPKK